MDTSTLIYSENLNKKIKDFALGKHSIGYLSDENTRPIEDIKVINEILEIIDNNNIDNILLINCLSEALEIESYELIDAILNKPDIHISISRNDILKKFILGGDFEWSGENNLIKRILNHPKFIEILDHHSGIYSDPYMGTAYHAVKHNRPDILKLLLEKAPNADYSFNDNLIIRTCINNNQTELVDLLLKNIYVQNALFNISLFESLNKNK